MSSEQSVTHWLRALENEDEEAARRLWDRYFENLVGVARKQLGATSRRMADEEDVALSVFRRLCECASRGRLIDVENRDQLWRVLVRISANRVIDQQRFNAQQKRGGGQVRGDSALTKCDDGGFDQLAGSAPTPELLAVLAEEHGRLMRLLDNDALRRIAQCKMDGWRNVDIAEDLAMTCRSVERKLKRIRDAWNAELTSREGID